MSQSYLYERRRQFRLHYPLAERPHVHINDRSYNVAELSEGGMKVLFADDSTVPEDFPITGIIRYVDGEEMTVTGKVLRVTAQGFSVQFGKGVSLRRIMADQIRLRQKYPMHFDHPDLSESGSRKTH